MGWHQTIIMGYVGRIDGSDPETENTGLRYTQSGAPVLGFSVAVTEKWTDRTTNQRQEKTTWYRVTCWQKLAEIMASMIEVGKQVMVVGNVEADAYTGNDGKPAASLKLTARDVQVLGGRGNASQASDDDMSYRGNNNEEIPF